MIFCSVDFDLQSWCREDIIAAGRSCKPVTTRRENMLTQENLSHYVMLRNRSGALPNLRAEVRAQLPKHNARFHEVLWVLIGNEALQMLDESVGQRNSSGFYAFYRAVNLLERSGFITREKLSLTLELASP